jgi:HPt (histidine-containing phosphotransfer) domain-containing protein
MTDSVERALQALQLEYLASLPARVEELRSDVAAFSAGSPEAAASLKVRLHRLAGSGASYGFVDVSSIAREAERWLVAHPLGGQTEELEAIIERLRKAGKR